MPEIASALDRNSPILVTGGGGMLGQAVVAELQRQGFTSILAPSRAMLDLTDAHAVSEFFCSHKPANVFHLAAVVFGLLGNMRNQLTAFSGNTIVNQNVLSACCESRVAKVVFAGTVAAYPYPYPALPLTEEMFWSGRPHRGEFGYAASKRHAIVHLELLKSEQGIDYCAALLTNLYGPHDRFDDHSGHVIPSLIKKMHSAVTTGDPFRVWGDGTATRDFLHVEDAARALVLCLEKGAGLVNVSSGVAVRLGEVTAALATAAGFTGRTVWETDKPVGIQDRWVCNRLLTGYGYRPQWDLASGLQMTWEWYLNNLSSARMNRQAA